MSLDYLTAFFNALCAAWLTLPAILGLYIWHQGLVRRDMLEEANDMSYFILALEGKLSAQDFAMAQQETSELIRELYGRPLCRGTPVAVHVPPRPWSPGRRMPPAPEVEQAAIIPVIPKQPPGRRSF